MGAPLIFHPPADQRGKYHRARAVTEVAACGAPVVLDLDPMLAVHHHDGQRLHPICCRRCAR